MTMRHKTAFLFFALGGLWVSAEEPVKTTVFEAKTAGYAGYRIPALAITNKGTLLAFCAARKELGDWADIDIALRRSTDGGKTWSPMRIIAERGTMTVDNPVPIVDRMTGAVHFLFQVNYAQLYYMSSDDDGETFSAPVDITEVVHNFRRGWASGQSPNRYGWTVVAPGPGHGIQLKSGRLLAAIWMSPSYHHRPSAVATVYSDDHGKTWKNGTLIPSGSLVNPSEHVAIELADGRVMTNIRSESPEHRRAVAYSPDGISNWTTPEFLGDLFEPVCMASLVRVSLIPEQKRNRIVFANPDSRPQNPAFSKENNMMSRDDLRVRLSYDEGQSWPVVKLLQEGGTGYSDMAAGPDGTMYILYEHVVTGAEGKNHNLAFARFTLEWLTAGKDKFE
jgi:sialidase-1